MKLVSAMVDRNSSYRWGDKMENVDDLLANPEKYMKVSMISYFSDP